MNPPQERNLAEAEETYIVRLIKLLPEYGVMSKERQEAVISLVNQAETEALAKREQETVKGCLEAHETARGQLCLKHADDDCDCDYCYHFHSAVKEINLKYPKE